MYPQLAFFVSLSVQFSESDSFDLYLTSNARQKYVYCPKRHVLDYDYALYLISETCFVLNISLRLSVQSCFCNASFGKQIQEKWGVVWRNG